MSTTIVDGAAGASVGVEPVITGSVVVAEDGGDCGGSTLAGVVGLAAGLLVEAVDGEPSPHPRGKAMMVTMTQYD